MSENDTPVVDTPAQDPIVPDPETTPPATTQQDPPKTDDSSEPMVEQKRFTGAIQKIQTLTEEARVTDQTLAAKDSEIEQLKRQQAVKDAETQAGYGERDKQLEAALKEKADIEAESKGLKSKLGKIELAKEIGHPELVEIIDTIPTFEDQELQKKAMEDIVGFTEARVKAREETLLAGVTPSVSPTSPVGDGLPSSDDAWQKAIEAEPDPTKREVMFDQWWDWGQKQKEK